MAVLQLMLGNGVRRLRRTDGVVVAILIVLAVLAIRVPDQLPETIAFVFNALISISPFLTASVFVAAYAKASGADNLIADAFQGSGMLMVGLAALMGAVSPFCSCGVIPLIAALLAMGVPLAPVMAFWLASPLMDPPMFVLTVGVLGLDFAIGKSLAAVGVGLLGGYGVWLLQRAGMLGNPLRDGVGNGGCAGARVRNPGPTVWRFWGEASRRRVFLDDGMKNFIFLGKWLALAFVLESLMLRFLPADWVVQLVGQDGWRSIVVAAVVGVPTYMNGYAALPLVGALIDQGMAAGAGMAFLIAGGVSSVPAAMAVFALARLPVFITYLGFALVGSIGAGLAYAMLA
ncbi:permease [Azoarcus taiwanensis]|nr:permease [Azoarcus taiwanensis]